MYQFKRLAVDAFPDVTPSLVQVFVETEGLAPEEVEKYVTYPIEMAMKGLPSLKEVRSVSNFGLSVVNIYFKDGTDIYFARQRVSEKLASAKDSIPERFGTPEMGPIATGLGQILFYVVTDESGKYGSEELREIQDWLIKYQLESVTGVTEVLSIGGLIKQFQVNVRPIDLLKYDISLLEVVEKLKSNNENIGAQFIINNSEEYVVRSIGLARDISDLENIALKAIDGQPIYLKDVANLQIGGEIRRGLATKDGKGEVVVGMVLKLVGTNTLDVIHRVKEKFDAINETLPAGVKAVPYYDQANLVSRCSKTVRSALRNSIFLVAMIIFIFMGGFRPSFVVVLCLPFSICLAFILMKFFNISANLMSLGGIVIAIGMMVDGTIIIIENVERFYSENLKNPSSKDLIPKAVLEVIRPISFAIMIVMVVFLPLLTLQGVEGKMFKPLAFTVILAMFGSLVYSLFMAPVFSSIVMSPSAFLKKHNKSKNSDIFKNIRAKYTFLLEACLLKRYKVLFASAAMLLFGGFIFFQLGSEFVPRLEEGDLLVRLTMAPSISLEESKKMTLVFEKRLLERFPEVEKVVTRVGRGEVGAHADPVNSAESFISFKPVSEWQRTKKHDKLYSMMSEYFENFPGVKFNFTQPIAVALDEMITGTKAQIAIKLFGPDMDILQEKSQKIEKVIKKVRGAADVQKDQVSGNPQVQITLNRKALARYGVSISDVQSLIKMSVGGVSAGEILEGVRRFGIYVRFEEDKRNTVEKIKNILVDTPEGSKVPLSQFVHIEKVIGARQISRENGQRFITVQCNVRERDIGSFVAECQKTLKKQLTLPPGYILDWGGQFELQQAANKRLSLIIPITLLIVFLILFIHFNSIKNVALILFIIPLAMTGGIIALKLSGQNLSVPSSVGFIALFGVALQDAMVLLTTIKNLRREGKDIKNACLDGANIVFRPVIMTTLTTSLGLISLLFSSGAGSEIQRPLATVVVGGLITSTFVSLLVLPAIYRWFDDVKPKEPSPL